jgi:hypothetical protein
MPTHTHGTYWCGGLNVVGRQVHTGCTVSAGGGGAPLCAERAALMRALQEGDTQFEVRWWTPPAAARARGGGARTHVHARARCAQRLFLATDKRSEFVAPCGAVRASAPALRVARHHHWRLLACRAAVP